MAEGQTEPPALVITIQSQVVHGCVGNTAATFPLRAAGLEVAAIPTVLLSNAPIYPTCHGGALPVETFAALLEGAVERGLTRRAAFLVTGYMGLAAIAAQVAAFVEGMKAQNPGCIYVCDPVLGNLAKGLYVGEDVAQVIANRLVPQADVLVPNLFELGFLARGPVESLPDVQAAREAAGMREACGLVVKGCALHDTAPGALEILCLDRRETVRIAFEKLPASKAGAGDLFTALLVAGLADGCGQADAARRAQALTSLSLARAFALNRPEVILTDTAFRRALLTEN